MRAMGRDEEVKHFSAPLRRFSPTILFSVLLVLSCFGDLRCGAQKLAQEEVQALKVIASKLRKHWDFSVDPCSRDASWLDPTSSKDVASNLTCECNATPGVCHVTSILLKRQNLTGYLPEEFADLTFLSVLDLSRNYLNGSLPGAWASLPLVQLSILGNRVSGSIPEEFGSISTLQNLTLEDNQLQGPIPAALGNLVNLSRLFLSANNFSGDLPDSLGNLKNLEDLYVNYENSTDVSIHTYCNGYNYHFVNSENSTDVSIHTYCNGYNYHFVNR